MKMPRKLAILIITLSDRAFKGEYNDLSGPEIKLMLEDHFLRSDLQAEIDHLLLPDDAPALKEEFVKASKVYNIIITTGGTGIGPSDITVETIQPLLDKEIPGIMEYIRIRYGSEKPNALLSRGVAGVSGNALVYTLPGSVRAVKEYMTEILKTMEHLIYMQYGIDVHDKPRS